MLQITNNSLPGSNRIINYIRRYVCRWLLFILGWHWPRAWYQMREQHEEVIAVVPCVQGWDLFIYSLIYWGYIQTRDRVYLWSNSQGLSSTQDNTALTQSGFLRWLLSNLPAIACRRNIHQETENQQSVQQTINQLKTHHNWALIVSPSAWSATDCRYSGYFYLARSLKASIVALQLNRYTKSVQISSICHFNPEWITNPQDQYLLVDQQVQFTTYDSYIPTNIPTGSYVAWCSFFLAPIDYSIFLPTLFFLPNLGITYFTSRFIWYPLIMYMLLWWYGAWCRLYRPNDRAIWQTCYEYHYLMQGVLMTELYYQSEINWWLGWPLITIYIFTWDYVRCMTSFVSINETMLNIHLQISLLICLSLF